MRIFRFLLPLLALSLIAGAKKPVLTIRFYTEANPVAGESFTTTTKRPGDSRSLTLSKIAQISEKDVVAIYPFPAANGTMGCAFKLDEHGKISLYTLSNECRGGLLVGFVNARAVTAMLIDRTVNDGIITISSGLKPEEIELMRQNFRVLGEKQPEKKSFFSTNRAAIHTPTPTPAPSEAPLLGR